MGVDWNIVAASIGFAGARAALFEYQSWKARRTSIPLDWNPRSQMFEPDLKLKRWEKIGRIAAWGAWGAVCIIGYNVIANGWLAGY